MAQLGLQLEDACVQHALDHLGVCVRVRFLRVVEREREREREGGRERESDSRVKKTG